MFAQLMMFQSFRTLTKGEFLYKAGDIGKYFYIVVTGKCELLVKTLGQSDFKFSK